MKALVSTAEVERDRRRDAEQQSREWAAACARRQTQAGTRDRRPAITQRATGTRSRPPLGGTS